MIKKEKLIRNLKKRFKFNWLKKKEILLFKKRNMKILRDNNKSLLRHMR